MGDKRIPISGGRCETDGYTNPNSREGKENVVMADL